MQRPLTGVERPEVFGDEGRLRNRFHTPAGAKLINALTLPMWRLLPPAGFGVLTTKGRRTGRTWRCCVRAVVRGREAIVVSIAGEGAAWLLNARHGRPVHLGTRTATGDGQVRDIPPEDLADARRTYCEALHISDYIECFLHRRGRPSRAKIRQLHERWFDMGTPIVITFNPR